MSRKILLDCLVFAARSQGTGPLRKGVWRWLGIGVLAVAVLALFAPASWAQADPVTVEVQVSGTARPGATLDAAALVTINDGSDFVSINWSQTSGALATISSPNASPTDVTLAAESAYKDQLIHVLNEPPIGPDQLPPNVPVPDEEFPAGLQNRFQIVSANPFALEEAELVTLKAEVTTTSGVYEGEAEILTEIPWKVKSEVRNVAIGIPVLLMGKDQTSYDWALYRRPWGSTATLTDTTSRYPEFTPDMRGEYVVTVTDMATDEMVQLEIFAGTWVGVITGQDENGRPVAGNCTPCHREAGRAPDVFPDWAQTGHAEIFSDNLNTSTHYGESCFVCHTVGYDLDVFNYGIDDSSFTNYQGFLDAGFLHPPASDDKWTMVLADFPKVARLANIQCENCHGPQSSLAHNQSGDPEPPLTGLRPRADISSNTCAVCHGEPLRHARFQQWQLSKHANYELAIDEGESASCSRCHSGNGFLTWLPILLGEAPGDPVDDLPASSMIWTEDAIHPQTCPVCHDPHQIGTTTGNNTNATVRISDDTPLLIAGFQAFNVGRGALCMTCHNTRRGLRNDNTWAEIKAAGDAARAPHGGVQADLLMGQNAYHVNLGSNNPYPPGLPAPGHSNQTAIPPEFDAVADTCAECHMEETPPPELLAYSGGGTNHTFFARSTICSNEGCHAPIADGGTECVAGGGDCDISDVQGPVSAKLATLEAAIATAIQTVMEEQIALGNSIHLSSTIIDATNVGDIEEIALEESRGRQAITVTLTGQEPVGPVAMNSVNVVDSLGAVRGELYDFADDNLPKSGWNYWLINTDKSLGVHNYNFAVAVLDASIAALPPAPAPAGAAAAASSSSPSLRTAIEVNLGEIK